MIHLDQVKRWHRYWFDDGGRLALAVIRIAIATSVLMILVELSRLPQLVAPEATYRPIGIWMLLGQSPPPEGLVVVLWAIAGASTMAMLFGIASRATTLISFVSALAITSLYYSGMAAWSHSHNVTFLAHLALLGGRCGDTLSIDARLRREPVNVQHGYQWSVRLVQIAVGLMFVSACFHKLRAGGFTLAWATSDNLRHQILARYDLADLPRPPIIDWLLAESWRYRGAALLNLLSQASPLLAIVFVRRPWVRAFVAFTFVVEAVAIDQLLGLPNWQWLPLAAVFVDWDYFLRRQQPPVTQAPPTKRIYLFIVGFLLYDLVISFTPKLDQRLNTYPFTAFQMFATVRSTPPWSEHRPYIMWGDNYQSDAPISREYEHKNRFMYLVTDPDKLRARLETIRPPGATFLRHNLALYVAPAYPAPPEFQQGVAATTGELTPEGFRTMLGSATSTTVTLRPQNIATDGVQLEYYATNEPAPIALAATRNGDTFTLAAPLPANAEHVVAVVGEARWLVWSRKHR